ncbi:MAG: CAP domain-containing protein, partial [Pyrinomonadaceae bacterium]
SYACSGIPSSTEPYRGAAVKWFTFDIQSGDSFYVRISTCNGPSADELTEGDRPRIVPTKSAEVKAEVKAAAYVKVSSVQHTVFDLINQKRAEVGLKPLIWNDDLEKIARGHSENMAEYDFFSHRGLDGKAVSDRADSAGLSKWRSIGENIAFNRGYADPIAKAVDLWLNSPSHKNNLLSPTWKESAVGVAITEDGSYYFTQVFLLRK